MGFQEELEASAAGGARAFLIIRLTTELFCPLPGRQLIVLTDACPQQYHPL